jgi:hypothetical protein
MAAITDALHRCRQSPADPVPDQEGTESELAILRAPTHANRIDISRAESIWLYSSTRKGCPAIAAAA